MDKNPKGNQGAISEEKRVLSVWGHPITKRNAVASSFFEEIVNALELRPSQEDKLSSLLLQMSRRIRSLRERTTSGRLADRSSRDTKARSRKGVPKGL